MHLVDTTMFFAQQSGGVKRYLLAKHGWLAHHSGVRHSMLVPGVDDSDNGQGLITLASTPIPGSGGYYFPVPGQRWIKCLEQLAPTLIEVGDPYTLAWIALAAGQRLGVPVVGFYHSDLTRFLVARMGRWCAPAVNAYVKRLYGRFDLVLAPSRIMAEKLQAVGVSRVALQPLGVDTALFHPRCRDLNLRRVLGLRASVRLLVFAGRLAREKNIPILLSALRRLGSEYHLLLIGAGTWPQPQSNVTFWPYQGCGTDLARLLASCDALVHAGDQETFGLVVLEAMACGLPVVGFASGAVAELVDESVGLLAPRVRVDDLAQAVAALYSEDLERRGHNGRQRVETHYGWDTVFRTQLGYYTHLAGLAPPVVATPLHAAG